MILAAILVLGIGGGFAGLAWGWREKFREADELRRRREARAFVDHVNRVGLSLDEVAEGFEELADAASRAAEAMRAALVGAVNSILKELRATERSDQQ